MFERELFEQLREAELFGWATQLEDELEHRYSVANHGDYAKWAAALERLPAAAPSTVNLDEPCIRIGNETDLDDASRARLGESLRELHPWRKGPFDLFGVYIDSEWRSDWKWQRLAAHISPLNGRRVLDVGCGNGYFAWRMRGAGADWVIGIDPTLVYAMQFQALQHYIGEPRVHVLPIGIDEVPTEQKAFDSVFSMGVFYHRRSPLGHLLELRGQLRAKGELVLETLVIEGDVNTVLVPKGRYARMRNVWFIPSVAALEQWLERCGFDNIRCVDVSATTPEEQRTTQWMRFQSLADFLNPTNSSKTIEGYPAPRRAIFIASA